MSIQQMLLGASGASGYLMDRSLRFRSSASAYLNRTFSAGNRNTWTWSGWRKRGQLGVAMTLLGSYPSGTAYGFIQFTSGDNLRFAQTTTGGNLITSQVFRDPAAYYHIVVAYDDTQATASNRVKIYVNGAQVTAFGTSTYPDQNFSGYINGAFAHYISQTGDNANYFDGYAAEDQFIGGQALTPLSFGETNALTGVWQPKAYTGTYGTNGFYLDFEDTSSVAALGTDKSGNGNTWTVNNVSLTSGVTYDSMTDVPTLTSATAANYAVFNRVASSSDITLSSGNLEAVRTTNNVCAHSTIAVSSGKWYWEVTAGETNDLPGICSTTDNLLTLQYPGATATSYGYYGSNGQKYNNGSSSAYGSTFTENDIIGVALDLDAGTLVFYKNNVSQGTAFTGLSGQFLFSVRPRNTANAGSTTKANFGQRPFAFSPPSGYVALNTFNLPTATILKGNTVMDATLYTGTGATLNVTNSGLMQPDFVWLKGRSSAYNHALFDSIRGANKVLFSNGTSAEQTETAGSLSSFNSDGFTLASGTATHAAVNVSGQTFVGWQWQAGQGTTSSNTNGSITSTVSVNATAGFSVVTYTGTGANATVGHGLGVAPKLIIVKTRSASGQEWQVYHASLGNTQGIYLSTTSAAITSGGFWNNTSPTSSTISLGTGGGVNSSGATYVAYCWSEIDGFSKFGSYTGNGSADGPFVYTGFRPKFIIGKPSSAVGEWRMFDTARSPYNAAQSELFPNLSNAEATNVAYSTDILSNGFKARNANTGLNDSGVTYIYMAFAESPFKQSLAR